MCRSLRTGPPKRTDSSTHSEAGGGLKHQQCCESHGAVVRCVGSRVDLGDIDCADARVARAGERDLPKFVCGDASGWCRRACRHLGTVTDVYVDIDMDGSALGAGHVKGARHYAPQIRPPWPSITNNVVTGSTSTQST